MGVPKFYRFISDRYPCVNKTVKEHEIPQYDNLYLDMNSIIHTCSHPNDSDIHFRIGKKEFSDEDIFQNVCRYVEIIFSIVKPIDVMYLAFDGVAPRAKMNQQRGHRFRAAKDMNEAVKNDMLQDDKLFDANCITTGTVFMTELIDHVKHFVAYKISTDLGWQKCKIIVSGSEVPGEGEHKIMEYIRYNKAQTNYNPNTRHCLYCLDADLIILGLCTHEPHFSLIREKVTFGKRMNMLTPEESDFELLHLSLLREYLEYEFTPIKTKLKFPFDLEKIIDDWVLIGFLVGNDFIPQLPNLNIVHGALPLLYHAYIEVLPTLDGYMNEFGELNITRFKIYLGKLSTFETKLSEPCKASEFLTHGSEFESDSSKDDSKTKVPGHKHSQPDINLSEPCRVSECLNNGSGPEENSLKDDSKIEEPVDNNLEQTAALTGEEKRKLLIENAFRALSLKCDGKKEEDSFGEEKSSIVTNNINVNNEKVLVESLVSNPIMAEYYKTKFKFDQVDRKKIAAIVEQYMKAIQWTLKYYYQGCCSWSWYYPYHYAPLISDFNELEELEFDFIMGSPFLPLQHLLAVLPPANVHLLPKALQCLLKNQNSPIIEFFPDDFEVDLNGKTNDWESIVLIPFIDENKLLKAMEPYIKNLSFKDRKRNTNGSTCIFTYTENSLGQYPVETIFDAFENHAQLKHIKVGDMHLPKNKLVQGLCSNVSFNISFPGFPTLKHVPHSFKSVQIESKFKTHHPHKIERMILRITPKPAIELAKLAEEFLGKKVYAYWPYLHEAFVIGVTDFKQKIILKNFWKGYNKDNVKIEELTKATTNNLHSNKKLITEIYKDICGIEIGKTDVLFFIFSKIGQCYTCVSNGRVQLQIKWSQLSKVLPYQLIVKDEEVQRHTFVLYKSMNDLFENSSACFMISQPNYGAKGEIKNVIERKQLISVTLKIPEEPDFSSFSKGLFQKDADSNYINCNEVAKTLKVSPTLISRITGSLIVTEEPITTKYHDVGLRMKFPKHDKELFGYTKKDENVWSYSEKALELIRSYMNQFPYLFENLDRNMKDAKPSTFAVSDLFPDGLEQLNFLKVWLSEEKSHYTTFVECHTQTLGLDGVPKLEKYVGEFHSKEHKQITTTIEVKPQSLFIPGSIAGLVPPDFKAEHKLLDRIVCVKNNFTVPLGLKGTVIGIQKKEEKCKYMYEVLFDSPFTGGLTLYESSEHRCYRLMATDFINISFGRRDVSNPRQARADAALRTKNLNRRSVDNANVNSNTGSQSNQANRSSGSFQAKNHNVRPKKTYTPARGSKAPIDFNRNNSDNNVEQNGNNPDGPRNLTDNQKRQNKPMSKKPIVSNNIDNCKQEIKCSTETLNKAVNVSQQNNTGTRPKVPMKKNYKQNKGSISEKADDKSPIVSQQNGTRPRSQVPFAKNDKNKNESIGEKLSHESANTSQPNNTGDRPKQPFKKKNGFKNQKNEYSRNTDAKKNATNRNKTVKQCQPNNTVPNRDTDKKSCDSKEDVKHQ